MNSIARGFAWIRIPWPDYGGKDIRASSEGLWPVGREPAAADRGPALGRDHCGRMRTGDRSPGSVDPARDGNQLGGRYGQRQSSGGPWRASSPPGLAGLAGRAGAVHHDDRGTGAGVRPAAAVCGGRTGVISVPLAATVTELVLKPLIGGTS